MATDTEWNYDEGITRPIFEIDMKGRPLDVTSRIIAALCRRLGGRVTLTSGELAAVQGLVISHRDHNVEVNAGNYFDEGKNNEQSFSSIATAPDSPESE